jgi:hypothetical protein
MSLIQNGKSDVRNHFSTHRKAHLHLVSSENRPDEPREQIEVATTSVSDAHLTFDQQSVFGSPASAIPAGENGKTPTETTKS